MPIQFISLNESFIKKIKQYGYHAQTIKIQDYIPSSNKKTYYISPANSLCFMDGGIDYALSRIVFPGIEQEIKSIVQQYGKINLVGQSYLPIGSSILLHKENNQSLCIAPTMLLPQNVSMTNNAYYATVAILYHILIHNKENIENVDILFTSFCCGYGHMNENDSIQQILQGIQDYIYYQPQTIINDTIILHEPNLLEQPKYYQNTQFFIIPSEDIIHC
jgi:O-acetyl-ADP-ribose deacetylase (regulator of RNase III)